MMRRAIVATGTALLGGLAYRLLQGLIGPGMLPNSGYIGLAVGASGATLAWYDARPRGWEYYLRPALLIVEVAIASVGVSVGAFNALGTQPPDLSVVLWSTISMLFFALIYASWWLVPALATVLWATNRLAAQYEPTRRVGPTP